MAHTPDRGAVVGARIDFLVNRAQAGECDLVVKGGSNQGERGYFYDAGSGLFIGNRSSDAPLSDTGLRQLAAQKGGELTYTCTPPGSGVRIGIDRSRGSSSRPAQALRSSFPLRRWYRG